MLWILNLVLWIHLDVVLLVRSLDLITLFSANLVLVITRLNVIILKGEDFLSLCTLLKMVFGAFPLETPTTPQDVNILYPRVKELIQKHLDAVISSQISLESANSMISFVLSVIKVLTEVQKFFIDPFLLPLTRVLQRLARDMGSSAASHVRQKHVVPVPSLYSHAPRSATGPPFGTRTVAGRILKESYGSANQQQTFTIEVLRSKKEEPLPP
ncbi:hypothetical protein C5167_012856 [Papaver somniferum]|uniref:DUF7699 domain-containing protein n=1 Tax=Papaver somniferum TaxID=3469 RepID=A0A4Y7IYP7_PAPSO|nr:hypothetical protein C5167_012856 [Papaver somniferum]